MESKQIKPGDTNYAAIHADWVSEGRAGQFDRSGKRDLGYGGAVYRVLDTSDDEPIFYQYASLPATTWDEESKGKVTKGWDFIDEEGWYQELWRDRQGRIHTRHVRAPNEL